MPPRPRRRELRSEAIRAVTGKSTASNTARSLQKAVLRCLDENKAEDVVTINLKGKAAFADAMVIASGRSQRHVGAMADHLAEALKAEGVHVRIEGMPHCDWVLIDAGDVIIHLFRPEVRDFYRLERLWSAEAEGGEPTAH